MKWLNEINPLALWLIWSLAFWSVFFVRMTAVEIAKILAK